MFGKDKVKANRDAFLKVYIRFHEVFDAKMVS